MLVIVLSVIANDQFQMGPITGYILFILIVNILRSSSNLCLLFNPYLFSALLFLISALWHWNFSNVFELFFWSFTGEFFSPSFSFDTAIFQGSHISFPDVHQNLQDIVSLEMCGLLWFYLKQICSIWFEICDFISVFYSLYIMQ